MHRVSFRRLFPFAILGAFVLGLALKAQEVATAETIKAKLATFQYLIGGWKGVGQPQRGSTKDNWTEQTEWAWDFSRKEPALVAKLKEARFFEKLRLSANRDGALELAATTSAGTEVIFPGKVEDDGRLVFTVAKPQEMLPSRVTIRSVANGDRLLVLYERPAATAGNWQRLGEVGATRIGSDFGKGSNGPECVVTGGLGTMPVMHEGKTYYVCCTGCRDLFNERPAEVLAEYRAKKEAEAKKKGMK